MGRLFKRKRRFLSTPSVGRATDDCTWDGVSAEISIHALRGEGDRALETTTAYLLDFYPRPPWGGRLAIWSPSAASRR